MAHPRFNALATILALAAALYLAAAAPFVGRWKYARLARTRDQDPAALMRFYRLSLLLQGSWVLLVLIVVAVAPGIHPATVGLAWPSGKGAPGATSLALELIALIVVTGLLFRRVVQRGRTIPGQRLFAAMIPSTPTERWMAAAVALGAGVSEEFLCRGLLIAAGIGIFGLTPLQAAVAAVAVFGMAHLYQGPVGVVLTAVVGAILVGLYFSSGSLLLPILVHAAIDIRGLVMVPAPPRQPVTAEPGDR
jgi:membrane protease YdiL (CAAX protease family)